MSEGKIPDFFKMFKGEDGKKKEEPKRNLEAEAMQAKKLYEEIAKYSPATLFAVLEILAMSECWVVDGLLAVIASSFHAQHNGTADKAKELIGLAKLLEALKKKEGGNDPTFS